MTGILIFMAVSLFLYTLLLKHYHVSSCPRCHSNKINIEHLTDYTLFTCQTCKFSYKDYDSFYTLTPICDQLEIDFSKYDEDDIDE